MFPKFSEFSKGLAPFWKKSCLLHFKMNTAIDCARYCKQTKCGGFSFEPLTPSGGMCKMVMKNQAVTEQPLEGAEYYSPL